MRRKPRGQRGEQAPRLLLDEAEVDLVRRVGGILLKRTYTDGTRVNAGDVLFEIDPAQYKVALSKAKAQLAQSKAQLLSAQQDWNRISTLFKQRIVSEKSKDDSVIVIERYVRPNKDYPNGRLTIVAGESLVYDGELPFACGEDGQRDLPFIRQACRKIVYGQLMLLPAFTYLLLNGLHALCRSVGIFHHFNVQSLLRVANPSAREVVIFRRHNIGV